MVVPSLYQYPTELLMPSLPYSVAPLGGTSRKRKQSSEAAAAAAVDPLHTAGSKKRKMAPTSLHTQQNKEAGPKGIAKILDSKKSPSTIDLTGDDDDPATAKVPKAAKGRKKAEASGRVQEKRLKRFRVTAPQKYLDYYNRAMTQRMFVVDRHRHTNDHCPWSTSDCPTETIDLAGTTGNVYQVTITHVPQCTCPDFRKGNAQCKHIVYMLAKVLKAPPNLQYQLGFLTSELREIFENAGPLPVEKVADEDKDGKRKPVEGDCPICCEDLIPESEEVVWCKAACGNNLHKTCFDRWAASKRGARVTCPYCRTAWQSTGSSLKALKMAGNVGSEGYVNIGQQLGLTGRRDYSSYHDFWVRRQRRNGAIIDEEDGDFEQDDE